MSKSIQLSKVVKFPERKEKTETDSLSPLKIIDAAIGNVGVAGFNSLHDQLAEKRVGLNKDKIREIINGEDVGISDYNIQNDIIDALCNSADEVIVEVK